MSSPAGRSAARRSRIARQFAQTHDRASEIVRRRLAPFFRQLANGVMAEMSRAHSEHVYIDQIFRPAEWGALFNAALIPGIKTTIHTGVSFEAEWVRSATGEATQQSISRMLVVMDDLHSIPHGNFHSEFSKDDFKTGRSGREAERGVGGLTVQKGLNPDLPDIGVALTDEMERDIGRFLQTRSVGVWAKVGETTKKALQETIRRGLKEGDSLQDLTKRVQGTLTHYSKYEAQRVARTETTAAMNFGQHAERNELGIEHKEWVSTIDARTRGNSAKAHFDHVSAGGQVTKNNVPFIVSAESLMYPGDISLGASAGNVIHCRCCAVGAWPHETLTGGGSSPRPLPPKLSPDDMTSYRATQALTDEQNSAATKRQIQEVLALLKKHDKELEKVRKETLEYTNRLQKARDASLKAEEKAINASEKYTEATDKGKKKLEKGLREANEEARKAAEDVADLVKNKADHMAKIIGKPGLRGKIELSFDDDVRDDVRDRARQASKWLQQSTNHTTTGDLKVHVKLVDPKDPRAYYHNGNIFMSPKSGVDIHVHEMGHAIEEHGDFLGASKGFLHSRTRGDVPIILRKQFPAYKFKPDEVALEDEFKKAFVTDVRKNGAYVGKYYRNNTEIVSMGMQLMYNDAVGFARRDPEYFKLIVGVMRGLVRIP